MFFKSSKAQPELVASRDTSRPMLTKVHLDTEAGEVWVTDSYKAARFPVEVEEGDTSGPIPVEALKASRKPPLRHISETSISLNSHAEVKMGRGEEASGPYLTVPRDKEDGYKFPSLPELFPDNLAPFEIGLDAKHLHDLAKAMGSDTIRLRFTMGGDREPSPLKPMLVEPLRCDATGGAKPRGLLMPIRLA
jgi:hypothetical protein